MESCLLGASYCVSAGSVCRMVISRSHLCFPSFPFPLRRIAQTFSGTLPPFKARTFVSSSQVSRPTFHRVSYAGTGNPVDVIKFEERGETPNANTAPASLLVTDLLSRVQQYEKKYGSLCRTWVGSRSKNPDPTVFYNDPGDASRKLYDSVTDVALVSVHPLISSVNTADINTIQGTYPVKPTFITDPETHESCTPGSEFVGVVKESNSSQEGLQPGCLVLPRTVGLGR